MLWRWIWAFFNNKICLSRRLLQTPLFRACVKCRCHLLRVFDRIRGDETNFNWFQSIGSASKICLNHFTWFWCVCTSWVLSITCVINGLCWVAQRTISTANKKMCSTDAWMWDLMNNTIGLNKEFCDSLNVLDWTFAPFLLPIRHHRCHYIRTHTHILKRCTMTFLYHR